MRNRAITNHNLAALSRLKTLTEEHKRRSVVYFDNGKMVERSFILGEYVFTAWEKSRPMGDHGWITTDAFGVWYGQIGSRRLPPEIEALKGGSAERIAACEKWWAAQVVEAHELIHRAFPETKGAADRGGCQANQLVMPATGGAR